MFVVENFRGESRGKKQARKKIKTLRLERHLRPTDTRIAKNVALQLRHCLKFQRWVQLEPLPRDTCQ